MSPEACAQMISNARSVAVFSGAGISTAAGIPDFRGPQGLYATGKYDPEKIFNIDIFPYEPEHFFGFTRDFLKVLSSIQPTFTHCLFASLEAAGRVSGVVTQNIDPLHNFAGSKNVIAVHGDYWTSHCMECDSCFDFEEFKVLLAEMEIPRCECGGIVKPGVVFFGEAVREMDRAIKLISECDVLFVLGSSLTVFPAASLPEFTPGRVIVVNRGPVAISESKQVEIVDTDLDTFFRSVAGHLSTAHRK